MIAREHGRFPLALRCFCSVRKLRILARRRPRRVRPAAARHPLGHHVRWDGACARCRTEPAGASHRLNELLLQCGREPPRHQTWSGNVPDRGRLLTPRRPFGCVDCRHCLRMPAWHRKGGVPRAASSVRARGGGVRALVTGTAGRLRSVPGCGVTLHRGYRTNHRRFIWRGAHGGTHGSRSILRPRSPASPPCSW
jgi:hypothetical protein